MFPGLSSSDIVQFNSGTPATQPSLNANENIASITFSSGANITIGGTNTLTISGGIAETGASATTGNISCNVTLGGAQTWSVSSPNSLTVGGNVSLAPTP